MVSNFPKPPPDSSPRNAGQCGRSNSVLLLYFLRIQNIQGIFPNIANNSKYSLVPKFQSPTRQLPSIFSQFSPAMAEGKFSTLVHLLKFIETFAVNYDWTEAFMMCEWKYCIFVRIYIIWENFYRIVLTLTMPANDNLKVKTTPRWKNFPNKKVQWLTSISYPATFRLRSPIVATPSLEAPAPPPPSPPSTAPSSPPSSPTPPSSPLL